MKSDINGCSTCPAGAEHYEEFSRQGKRYVQYDYRAPEGALFSTVAPTVDEARRRRDAWLTRVCAAAGVSSHQ